MAAGTYPLEPLNRKIFAFNETIDRWLTRPVADACVELAPSPIQRGIGNVLRNLAAATSVLNRRLQGGVDNAYLGLATFVVNTTAGVGSLIDLPMPGPVTAISLGLSWFSIIPTIPAIASSIRNAHKPNFLGNQGPSFFRNRSS
ncbi:MAG: MlaA family lipoprotein [Pseudomonadota bacterium]